MLPHQAPPADSSRNMAAELVKRQEKELRLTRFFSLDDQSSQQVFPFDAAQEEMERTVGMAFIRYSKSFRVATWRAFLTNSTVITSLRNNSLQQKREVKMRNLLQVQRQKNKSSSSTNKKRRSNENQQSSLPPPVRVSVNRRRDEVYTGGAYKPVNCYVQIREPVEDEKTKYLYRDQPSIGLKKSDQIQSTFKGSPHPPCPPPALTPPPSSDRKGLPGLTDVSSINVQGQFVTRQSEHLLKCIVKELQFRLGASNSTLHRFQKVICENSDFRIPQLWWRAFGERHRLLIESRLERLESVRRYKVHVFKYNYFLCSICLHYNCMLHRRPADDDPPLRDDNWSVHFDKNIPKHQINPDKVKDFLAAYNGFNYANKFVCCDVQHEHCYRNPSHKTHRDLVSVQQSSFEALNKRWIHALLYFAKTFGFLNPCLITLILNMSKSPHSAPYKCKDVMQYIVSRRYFQYERVKSEIDTFMKCRQNETLRRLSHISLLDYSSGQTIESSEYIQQQFHILPTSKEDILAQLRRLSDMLHCGYTPCFHEGVCDAGNGCLCYRNREIVEKIQRRVDKFRQIERKDKKTTRVPLALELAFDDDNTAAAAATTAATNDEDSAALPSSAVDQFEEIISKYLHECETFCGCPNYCRTKNKKLGCSCLNDMTCSSDKQCQCRSRNRECDPEVCRCFCNRNARTIQRFKLGIDYCTNSQALYKCKMRLVLAKSLVCDGMGLFAGQDFKRNAYIGTYLGELINQKQGTERQEVQQPQGISYLFMVNDQSDVDSFRYGNKMRFANHNCGSMANCKVEIIYSKCGMNLVRFTANQDIARGQEIYFDYNRSYLIDWMKSFNAHFDHFEATTATTNTVSDDRKHKKQHQHHTFIKPTATASTPMKREERMQ